MHKLGIATKGMVPLSLTQGAGVHRCTPWHPCDARHALRCSGRRAGWRRWCRKRCSARRLPRWRQRYRGGCRPCTAPSTQHSTVRVHAHNPVIALLAIGVPAQLLTAAALPGRQSGAHFPAPRPCNHYHSPPTRLPIHPLQLAPAQRAWHLGPALTWMRWLQTCSTSPPGVSAWTWPTPTTSSGCST